MTSRPGRSWTTSELATILGIPARPLRPSLAAWARKGLLTRPSPGKYAPPQQQPP